MGEGQTNQQPLNKEKRSWPSRTLLPSAPRQQSPVAQPVRQSRGWPSLARTRALPVLTGNAAFSPRIDVKEDDASFEISAELPGLEEKDIEITVDDGTLVLRGEKSGELARKRKASTSARSASTVASSAPSTCLMACRTTPLKPSSKTASSPSTCPRRRRRKRSSARSKSRPG